MEKEITANQAWRASGTTLVFKDWIKREKEKYLNFTSEEILINKPLNDSVQAGLSEMKKKQEELRRLGGYRNTSANNGTLGIDNKILILSGMIIAGAIVYTLVKKKK